MIKVISSKNLPTRPPLVASVVAWLALDRSHAPSWLWGCVGTLLLAVWVLCIYVMANEKSVNILEKTDGSPS